MRCYLLMAVYNLFADSIMQTGRGEVGGTRTRSFETLRRLGGGNLTEGAVGKVGKSQGLAAQTSAGAAGLAYSTEQPVGT